MPNEWPSEDLNNARLGSPPQANPVSPISRADQIEEDRSDIFQQIKPLSQHQNSDEDVVGKIPCTEIDSDLTEVDSPEPSRKSLDLNSEETNNPGSFDVPEDRVGPGSPRGFSDSSAGSPMSESSQACPRSTSSPGVETSEESESGRRDNRTSPEPGSDMPLCKKLPCKNGAAKQQSRLHPDAQCQVCGEKASGNFFGALVCLPCKSFFIRCTKESEPVFVSHCDGRCDISKQGRNRCQYCRYEKCIAAGMSRKEKPEAVEPGEGQLLCLVCGDIANGIHFGVYTCEGCKKFFRRGMQEFQTYVCKGNMTCLLNPRNRNNCRYCRYQKCLNVGMSREAIKMGRPKKIGRDDGVNPVSCSGNKEMIVESRTPAHELQERNECNGSPDFVSSLSRLNRRSPSSDSDSSDNSCIIPLDRLPLKKCILRYLLSVKEQMMESNEQNKKLDCQQHCQFGAEESRVCEPPSRFMPSSTAAPTVFSNCSCPPHSNDIQDHSLSTQCVFYQSGVNSCQQQCSKRKFQTSACHNNRHINWPEADHNESIRPKRPRMEHCSSSSCVGGITQVPGMNGNVYRGDFDRFPKESGPVFGVNRPLDLSNPIKQPSQPMNINATPTEAVGSPNGQCKLPFVHKPIPNYFYEEQVPDTHPNVVEQKMASDNMKQEYHANILKGSHGYSISEEQYLNSLDSTYTKHLRNLCVEEARNGDMTPEQSSYGKASDGLNDESLEMNRNLVYQIDGAVLDEVDSFYLKSLILLENIQHRLKAANNWFNWDTPVAVAPSSDSTGYQHHLDPIYRSRNGNHHFNKWILNQLVLPGERSVAYRLESLLRFDPVGVCQYWKRINPISSKMHMSSNQHKILQDMLEAYMEMLHNCDEGHLTPCEKYSEMCNGPKNEPSHLGQFVVKRIIRQIKEELQFMFKVPGFKDFHPDDRMFIIQNMSFANVTLMGIRDWYDPKTKTFKNMMTWELPKGHPLYMFRRNAMRLAERVLQLQVDRTEAAMLSALNVTAADFTNVKDPRVIERSKDFLLEALTAHLSYKGVDPGPRLKDLLDLMPALRLCGLWSKSIREEIALKAHGDNMDSVESLDEQLESIF